MPKERVKEDTHIRKSHSVVDSGDFFFFFFIMTYVYGTEKRMKGKEAGE